MPANPRLDNAPQDQGRPWANITARSWQTEAAMRMLMNNLDDEVAEKPGELVVYGGIGRAARDWACYDKIVATLNDVVSDRDAAGAAGQAGGRVPDPPPMRRAC